MCPSRALWSIHRDEPLARSADTAGGNPAGRLPYDKAYADAVGRLARGIAGTFADMRFREALTWQNPGLAQFLHDHDAGPGAARRSKQRQRELVIASYLQRYCLKNDTIGFFGPVGWATAEPGTAGLLVTPGEQLLAPGRGLGLGVRQGRAGTLLPGAALAAGPRVARAGVLPRSGRAQAHRR